MGSGDIVSQDTAVEDRVVDRVEEDQDTARSNQFYRADICPRFAVRFAPEETV